ncbi:hypothetical protein TRIATDRAFT_204756 [Trichoderma atroviride IMI 206040]|uniref:Aminoglycoside phosphotransferase domain-containing protein n=1 Tax=Hypocrea atroviridis (strain ATCC 20476 / IMI 206040) TaxID=452589 RepID=G9P420_HYPAI|nr:uncharacterized protein TRIATDRAFT_204756 [Trichoderma atroviride IMI 206040]EHK41077.1 hypothetical protein TRIATDRAFT_204756 [Trichoderma atroviride IMI 206040]
MDPLEILELDTPDFFVSAGITRQACDDWLRRFHEGSFTPLPEQSNSSYSVCVGQDQDRILQFRLKPSPLDADAINLARRIYGSSVPAVVVEAQLGDDDGEKPPVLVYSIDCMRGTDYSSYLFFFAAAWNSPRQLCSEDRAVEKQTHINNLQSLLCLPVEFHPIIQACIKQMDAVMRLPMVVYHTNLSKESFTVDHECQLVGILSWSRLAIGPFGLNLHVLEEISGDFSLQYGRSDFFDHKDLQCLFWDSLSRAVGGLTPKKTRSIKVAMIVGFLQRWGLAWKLATYPGPEAASTVDEISQFNLAVMKSYLIDPTTRFEGVKELLA